MTHRDAVIDRDGIELLRHATCLLDLARHQLTHIFQMNMPRHKLGKRIGDGDDRLAKIAVFHAGGAPQCAGAGHVAAMGGGFGAIVGHGRPLDTLCYKERKDSRFGALARWNPAISPSP